MLEIMNTLLSPYPKQLYLKIEVLVYDTNTKHFIPINTAIIDTNLIPKHLTWEGDPALDPQQEVKQQLSLTLANVPTPYGKGMHNWGAFFNPNNEFMWWLDKRLRLSIGVRLDTPVEMGSGNIEEIGWIPKGIFALVNFESDHTLTGFPAVNLTASSLEALFTGKRGKFLNPQTLVRHTVATEAIRTLVKGYIPENTIRIDPSIGLTGEILEKGDEADKWAPAANCTVSTSTEFMYGVTGKDTSILIHSEVYVPGPLATKHFDNPINIYEMDSVALWVRTSHNFFDAELGIRFTDSEGNIAESGLLATIGHVIDGDHVVQLSLDNWRNMMLSLDGAFQEMENIVSIQIFLASEIPKLPNGFDIWIDNIYTAQSKTTLPYELSYGAGSNRWQAIEEVAELIDCDAYFDEQGDFIVKKRRIPKEKDGNYYNYDKYEIPVPVITFKDKLEGNNVYAGSHSQFIEYDLANHTQALGGATYQPIPCVAEFALRTDGLHMKEKGMRINKRGRPRPVNRDVIYNADTNIEELYENDKNKDQILLDYPTPPAFASMVEPPLSNFAIERIGDMIYHHNNAAYDPIIFYTYEAKNRALWEMKKRLAYAEQVMVTIAPYYLLRPYDIIRIEDTLLNLSDNYEIRGLEIPLNGEAMQLTVHKIRGAVLDIPFFDESYTKRSTSWYNMSYHSLCFTFPSWDRRWW